MRINFKKKVLSFLLLGSFCTMAHAAVVINEAMPCNLNTYMDNGTYNYSPWVEIYNKDSVAVNLNGYYLLYKPLEEDTIKEAVIDYDLKIAGKGYVLLYFDKVAGKHNHICYKLDADGGELTLTDPSGKVVSTLNIPDMCSYVSYGAKGSKRGYMEPTPGKANTTAFEDKTLSEFIKNSQCAAPTFGTPAKLVVNEEKISTTLSSATADAKIYYTTDGTVPTPTNGTLYNNKPIEMEKTTTLRARAYQDEKICSPISTASYIFNDSKHKYCGDLGQIPIVSIVTDPANFKDDKIGIGVKGSNGIKGICGSLGVANYNQDWKRPMNFEYFVDGKAVISHELEGKVMGGCSRQYDTKSLALSASKKCGSGKNKMNYVFFKDKPTVKKYKSLHLRNGGNDYDGLRFRDLFMQSLIKGTNIDYQAGRPVGYYLNGKYQGLMLLNEHANSDFVYSNYGLDDEEIDFIKLAKSIEASEGTTDAYFAMIEAAKVGQNTPGYCDKMNKLMDLDEYMTYMAFEQFIVNTDWPGNNNKLWRSKKSGRFRWILYDTDFGFGMYESWSPNYTGPETDMIKFCQGLGSAVNWGNGTNNTPYVINKESEWKTELFANLMKDDEFRSKFLTKNMMLLSSRLKSDVIKAKLDSVANEAYPEYCAMSANEYYQPEYDKDSEFKSLKSFADQRPAIVYKQLAENFGGSLVDLNITSNTSGARFIINGLYWDQSKYEDKYVSNNVLTVEPIAPEGYKFKNWKLSSSASSVLLNSASEWLCHYNEEPVAGTWNTANFKATGWATVSGKVGYGPGSYDSKLTYDDADNKPITAYFRTTVNIDDIDNYSKLVAKIAYDDGYILYVNGKEIDRENISAEEVDGETLADDYTNDATKEVEIAMSAIKQGENVIAVEIHQNVATSSDLTFEMSLRAAGKASGTTASKKTYSAVVSDNFSMEAVFEKEETPSKVFINEVCTSNQHKTNAIDNKELGFADEYGKFGDWIELYNNGDEDINIAGWYITDNAAKLTKYQIPTNEPQQTIVPAHGYKMIWCDGDSWNGPLHASFKLGESTANTIILSKTASNMVDTMTVIAGLGTNNSYGCKTDGNKKSRMKFIKCSENTELAPTPLAKNGSVTCTECQEKEEYSDEVNKNTIVLYPNPVYEELNIASSIDDLVSISIYDYSGRLIRQEVTNGKKCSIATSNLASGIYQVNIKTENNNVRMKFIKK